MKAINLEPINILLSQLAGFSPFLETDIDAYLHDSEHFALHLPKEPGKGYLYGLELVGLRQALFNDLDLEHRCTIFRSKLTHGGLGQVLEDWLYTKNEGLDGLVNCCDIGMGHSVYRLDFSSGYRCVVKACEENYMSFFSHVLNLFGFNSIPVLDVKTELGSWQFADYVAGDHVSHCILEGRVTSNLVEQLARQACLGDVLGRGDRHFENYLLVDDVLYPLDVSYMFWPDNEIWVQRYIEGGQSECCVLEYFPDYEEIFWNAYAAMWEELKQRKVDVLGGIRRFYTGDAAEQAVSFVEHRLASSLYVDQRRASASAALVVYRERLGYKSKLAERVATGSGDLDAMLWMYYYANKDRLTAFFLIDFFERENALELI